MGRFEKAKRSGTRGVALAIGAALTVGMAVTAPQAASAAETSAVLEVKKTASATELKPGETMEYRIEVGCSSITDLGCRDAVLSDLIPAEFEIIPGSVAVSNVSAAPPVVDGNQVTVTFTEELGDGTIGLTDNTDGVITIQVKLREDLEYEEPAKPIVNTATLNADNAEQVSDNATVTPIVDLDLRTTVEKSFNPKAGQAKPGQQTQLTVTGTNTSNAGVDALSLTDPIDPTATPNPFDYLEITAMETLTFPEGATDTATVEYFIDGNWVPFELKSSDMPHAPPSADAKGVRVTFHAADGSKIPVNAGGGFTLNLEQRDAVAELTETTQVLNDVQSEVTLGDENKTAENEADYTIAVEDLSVGAAKEFDTDELLAGETTGVTISGTNTSLVDLETLTIREPATGVFGEVDGTKMLEFTGFTSTVQFPSGATGGELTLEYIASDGTTQSETFTLQDGQPFPELPGDFKSLNYFEVTFTSPAPGSITSGGSSEIKFDVVATEDSEPNAQVVNEIAVTGTNENGEANNDADDTLTFAEQHLELETVKKVNPGEMWGYKGETATVQLPTTLKKPESNANAHHIVITDPALTDPSDPDSAPVSSSFWDSFQPKQITKTDVPAGATLTIRYYDKVDGAWKVLEGAENIVGATSFSMTIPEELRDRIGGLQFDFANEDPGFAPGNTVQPNFASELKEGLPAVEAPGGQHEIVENCSASVATGGVGVEPGVSPESCNEVQINNPIIGVHDLLEKRWIDPADQILPSRSGAHATSRLYWSTGGRTGVDQMVISDSRLAPGGVFDPAAGPSDAIEKSVYNALNLVKIKAITPELDPSLKWDQVADVQLWNSSTGTWDTISAAAGKLPFVGSVPELALTPAEQVSTTAVRLIFEENAAAREASSDPLAPAVGSGVAKTNSASPISEGVRSLDLEWELRDSKRSPAGEPVLGTEIFNTETEGDVNNIASGTSVDGDGTVLGHDDDGDIISIIDRPVTVTLNKGWAGGALGVPPTDVPQDQYPTSRVTLVAKNTSVTQLEQLDIIDAGPGGADPFDVFNVSRIVSASNNVAGADPDKTVVVLTDAAGVETRLAPGQAVALADTAAGRETLASTVKVQLHHEGKADAEGNTNSILSNATSTLVMDLQLRKTHRDGGAPVTTVDSPVKNGAIALACDLCGLPSAPTGSHAEAEDDAQIKLDTFDIAVQTTKGFAPDQQLVEYIRGEPEYDAEEWDAIQMNLTARPTGSGRVDKLVVTDSGENRVAGQASAKSFWNAFRFVGFTGDTLAVPAPITHVQAEVLYGDFSEQAGNRLNFTPQGAGWVAGSDVPVAATGGKIDGARAALLANVADADFDKIRGIRLTYTRVGAADARVAFENPANPEVKISLDVKRRAYLVSTPTEPVPSSGAAISAPGEPANAPGGLFNNTVDADTESFVKQSGGSGPMLTAHDDATARVTYLSDGIEVAVEKTPVGAQRPGEVIPFKLKTTNTSKRSTDPDENEESGILDPFIIDYFPVADGKPQLVFDPDMDPEKYFSFELTNPLYPSATKVMPIDPAKITVTFLDETLEGPAAPGDEIFGVKFEFPQGTVMYPEEAYTITANMMFRPGLVAGSENAVTNRFAVVSPHQNFNSCNFASEHESKECWADTEVYPTESGALRGKKYVRANDTELGIADVPNPAAGRECQPQFAEEYSFSNCVPVTKPLGKETWREELQNTGTLPMDTVVTIDSLPRVDDQGAIVLLPRKSEWQPAWIGNSAIVSDTAPDGQRYRDDVTFTQFYSSSAGAACTADLKPSEAVQCDGFWQPLTASVDPATVLHVKTVFDFTAKPLAPGERLAYTFETRTPAQSPKMTADTVAWNSIAVGGQTVGGDGRTSSVLPTEGIRVGVSLATGPLAVEKLVTGPGAEFAPDEFQVEVLCTVPAREGAAAVTLDPISVTVPAGEVVTLDEQFPWGAECELRDVQGANGETSSEAVKVTVGADETTPVATLTNTYEVGSFEIQKQVEGAENQDQEAIDYGAFPVKAECTFLGEELELPVAEAELTAGGLKWLVQNLPVGATCTITELDAQGGAASLTLNGEVVAPNEDGSWTITVTEGEAALNLQLTNVMPLGQVEIEKQLVGEGVSLVPDATVFEFTVECTFEGKTVWAGALEQTKAEALAGEKLTIGKLPVGAECGVTETATGGASQEPTITPESLTIGSDEGATFAVVNTFDAGDLHVTKEVVGDGAERWGAGPFEVSLECTFNDTSIPVPGGAERELTAEGGFEADYTGLPVGAECGLTETVTGGATSSEILTAEGEAITGPVTIGGGDALQLRVVNTFDVGSLQVTKQIAGDGASLAADKVFTVALTCSVERDGETVEIEVPEGAERELSKAGGLTATYEELPAGAECELRETDAGGASAVTITPNAGDAAVGAATVAADEVIELTVVNEFVLPPVTPEPPTGGKLPGTGGGLPVSWLLGGGALLLAGAVALVGTRVRQRNSAE
ncbi:DUF5979 domain-containing protein [Leucobacter aridicollis]|uniref:DUF5979 domain-containing protein n=1 Tax=Leucobacter aridicollis TaxID=283878 RepID=UPI0021073259|nr:DUF5979 domain-containing protein [Leucobacter aridicollis]UTX53232.1 hypothetical protein KI794_00200 [Leucobacter aridicollis]